MTLDLYAHLFPTISTTMPTVSTPSAGRRLTVWRTSCGLEVT
jgi:hypothetical protein